MLPDNGPIEVMIFIGSSFILSDLTESPNDAMPRNIVYAASRRSTYCIHNAVFLYF